MLVSVAWSPGTMIRAMTVLAARERRVGVVCGDARRSPWRAARRGPLRSVVHTYVCMVREDNTQQQNRVCVYMGQIHEYIVVVLFRE